MLRSSTNIIRRAAAWSLLMVLLFALTPREAWHACFDAHDEVAHCEGATYSEHCAICDAPAPLAAETHAAPLEELRVIVKAELGPVLLAPVTLVQESPTDRGPPALA